MKKVLFIMAAALMTMTQCRKQETMPVTPTADTIKMTIAAGPGRTDISTETGAITWSEGDKLYVSDGTNWLGSLTLVSGENTPQGTFSGNVGLGGGTTPCHFFYLGKDNGMTEPTAGTDTGAVISFAEQNGKLNGAMKYHTGYGRTDVTVTEGEATGSVIMNTKIAIAHLDLTTDGTNAYKGFVTMGGTGISNVMTVNPDGTFSGSGDGGITIGNGYGTTGERYVTLIPTEGASVSVAFTGDATGSMAFANGIYENKFYGMKDAMAVTVTPKPKFSVGENTTVEFAPGNLYWDGSAFRFEANQWSFASTWDASHVSHFKWSDAANAVTGDQTYNGGLFCASNFTVTGDSHTDWRTLSKAEWDCLLNSRDNANNLHAWKELDNGTHKGLVILPDGTEDPSTVMGSITSTDALATYGAVFLPAAGSRDGTEMYDAGLSDRYWSSTLFEGNEDNAYYMYFDSGHVVTYNVIRYVGHAVRFVR